MFLLTDTVEIKVPAVSAIAIICLKQKGNKEIRLLVHMGEPIKHTEKSVKNKHREMRFFKSPNNTNTMPFSNGKVLMFEISHF